MNNNALKSSEDCNTKFTPSETTEHSCEYGWHFPSETQTTPCAGRKYMIRERKSGKVLMLIDGQLCLDPNTESQGGWRWHCVENSGQLGFREASSGRYLGRDGNDGFKATAKHHREWEYFQLRSHQGGHQLLSPHWSAFIRVGLADNGNRLIDAPSAAEGVVWDFVEV
jgi:hypothetical protein